MNNFKKLNKIVMSRYMNIHSINYVEYTEVHSQMPSEVPPLTCSIFLHAHILDMSYN